MMNKKWFVGALVAAMGLAGVSSASAQAPKEPEAANEEDGAQKEEASKHPMGWFGLGLTLGVGSVGSGSFSTDNPAYDSSGITGAAGAHTGIAGCDFSQPKCQVSTNARTGFQLTLKMTMGGDGFGWDVDPYINLASNNTAYGMYTGPKYDIHAIDPLYIAIGFGPKLAWVQAKGYNYGADVYGRGMVRGTYYLLNELGIVAELGVGYGYSGYVATPQTLANGMKSDTKINFGSAVTWDFTVGTRWP